VTGASCGGNHNEAGSNGGGAQMATSPTFQAIPQAPRIATDPQIRSLYLKASYVLHRNDTLLLLASRQANAAECGSMANRVNFRDPNGAIGVGRNGAATYNKNAGGGSYLSSTEFEPGRAGCKYPGLARP
jgi:hypothetical protein